MPSGGFYMQEGTSTAKRTSRPKSVLVYSVKNMFKPSGGIGYQLFSIKMKSEDAANTIKCTAEII